MQSKVCVLVKSLKHIFDIKCSHLHSLLIAVSGPFKPPTLNAFLIFRCICVILPMVDFKGYAF